MLPNNHMSSCLLFHPHFIVYIERASLRKQVVSASLPWAARFKNYLSSLTPGRDAGLETAHATAPTANVVVTCAFAAAPLVQYQYKIQSGGGVCMYTCSEVPNSTSKQNIHVRISETTMHKSYWCQHMDYLMVKQTD